MNDSPAQLAARARAARRKKMQQRQTVIFGSIIAVLLGVALLAGAVWAEIIPAPFTIDIKAPEPQETPAVTQPCPPEGAHPIPLEEVTVNVLNSTSTSGLGARTADGLKELGVVVESVGNASSLYLGSAKVVAGVEYLDIAYTAADLIPEAQIVLDGRTENIVDIVLGSAFTDVRTKEDLRLHPDEPIPAPAGCVPPEELEEIAPPGDGDVGEDTGDTDGEAEKKEE